MRIVVFCLSFTVPALAEDEPAGLSSLDPASAGSTDVAQEGFQSVAQADEESTDTVALSIILGGLLATGNSRSLSLTGASDFKLRRDIHQLTAVAAANYGRAATAADEPVETTVENYQGRVRYDVFLSQAVAAFLQISARHDRFQGLDLRLNVDPGFAYYFLDQKHQQFWAELGYDFQYDVRRDEALTVAEDDGFVVQKTQARHHARAFVGYDNKLNQAVTFRTGLEYLQGLAPFEDEETDRTNWRLNGDAALTSSIAQSLSVATTFSVKYDNNPLPTLARTDTVSSVSLVYTLQ
jgi:putative salt-induced outer membrane protein